MIVSLPPASEGWGKVMFSHVSVCLSVYTCRGDYPISGQDRWVPCSRSGCVVGGTHFPGQDRGGNPSQVRMGVLPLKVRMRGYPHPRSGWGYCGVPLSAGWGTLPPSRSGWGYPFPGQDGGTQSYVRMGVP